MRSVANARSNHVSHFLENCNCFFYLFCSRELWRMIELLLERRKTNYSQVYLLYENWYNCVRPFLSLNVTKRKSKLIVFLQLLVTIYEKLKFVGVSTSNIVPTKTRRHWGDILISKSKCYVGNEEFFTYFHPLNTCLSKLKQSIQSSGNNNISNIRTKWHRLSNFVWTCHGMMIRTILAILLLFYLSP